MSEGERKIKRRSIQLQESEDEHEVTPKEAAPYKGTSIH
jgi:hypothetical protein